MPKKGKSKSTPARNKTKTTKKMSKDVRSFSKNIQNANYIAPNRLVKFTDFRSYVVLDDGLNGTGAIPPLLQVGLNNPRKFIESLQGTWKKNSLTAKGQGVPGITRWLANKIPGTTSVADYLTGSCKGAQVTITVTPIGVNADEYDSYQPICKVALANQTRTGHLKNKNIDLNFNSERVSQLPMVRTANVYLNNGGTPRGTTLKLNYSFKKNNADPGKQSANIFYADTDPEEKDIASLAIMPGDSNAYGVLGSRCPPMRVEVRISYIVLLTEPNTHIGRAINDGNNLSDVAQLASGLAGMSLRETSI